MTYPIAEFVIAVYNARLSNILTVITKINSIYYLIYLDEKLQGLWKQSVFSFLRPDGAGTEMIMNKTATIGYLSAGNRICSRVISDDFSGIARLLLPCCYLFFYEH